VGIVGCTLGTALAIWLALANTLGQITWTDTGYQVVDDRSVSVDFDVDRAPGQAVTCRVKALDQAFGVVGVVDVPIPPTTQRTVHHRTVVRTASRAVTGVVDTCLATG
jgi:hypothetical protein